jgi:hypothetical protein
MFVRCAALAVSIPLLSASQAVSPGDLPPTSCVRDDAASDPSFVEFRQRLLRIIEARDAQALLALTEANVYLGHDEERGLDALKRNYGPDDPQSLIWPSLRNALLLGGRPLVSDKDAVLTPSIVCREDESEEYDYAYTACIIGTDVAARTEPSLTAPVLRRYSCERVSVSFDDALRRGLPLPQRIAGWQPVLIGKQWGYVNQRFVRVFEPEEVSFARTGGEWRWSGVEFGD